MSNRLVEDRRYSNRTNAMLVLAMGEIVDMITDEDPLTEIREGLRVWAREADRGRDLSGAVRTARTTVAGRTDQRATRSAGPLGNVLRRDQLRERRRQRVREGDGIFIDDSDEEALRTGRPPRPAGQRRNATPGPSGTQDIPRRDRLVPIEVVDENEESGFRVVPAIDLTYESD